MLHRRGRYYVKAFRFRIGAFFFFFENFYPPSPFFLNFHFSDNPAPNILRILHFLCKIENFCTKNRILVEFLKI